MCKNILLKGGAIMEEIYCSICGEELSQEEIQDNIDACIECSMKKFIIYKMREAREYTSFFFCLKKANKSWYISTYIYT